MAWRLLYCHSEMPRDHQSIAKARELRCVSGSLGRERDEQPGDNREKSWRRARLSTTNCFVMGPGQFENTGDKMTRSTVVGVVLFGGAMTAATPGCIAEMAESSESAAAHEGSTAQDDAKNKEEDIGSASQAIVASYVATCQAFGQQQATCDAICQPGYIATGGGCKVSTIFWDIGESSPLAAISATQGWRCLGNEDFGSKAFNHSVYGYAVCIMF